MIEIDMYGGLHNAQKVLGDVLVPECCLLGGLGEDFWWIKVWDDLS